MLKNELCCEREEERVRASDRGPVVNQVMQHKLTLNCLPQTQTECARRVPTKTATFKLVKFPKPSFFDTGTTTFVTRI